MITFAQAKTANEFHFAKMCRFSTGPKSGITYRFEVWRRNGRTKTWKTRPGEFQIPVKYGLYSFDYITHNMAADFHVAEECPVLPNVKQTIEKKAKEIQKRLRKAAQKAHPEKTAEEEQLNLFPPKDGTK